MKPRNLLLIVLLVVAMSVSSFAQERTYKTGSTWTVSFVQIKNGMSRDYLNSLKTTWKSFQDEDIKQ